MTGDETWRQFHEVGSAVVREWSESNGKGLALGILIAKAIAKEVAAAREAALREAWVPCSERMPAPDGTPVIVLHVDGDVEVCEYHAVEDGEVWLTPIHGDQLVDEPTYWMPLPPPPPPTKGTNV